MKVASEMFSPRHFEPALGVRLQQPLVRVGAEIHGFATVVSDGRAMMGTSIKVCLVSTDLRTGRVERSSDLTITQAFAVRPRQALGFSFRIKVAAHTTPTELGRFEHRVVLTAAFEGSADQSTSTPVVLISSAAETSHDASEAHDDTRTRSGSYPIYARPSRCLAKDSTDRWRPARVLGLDDRGVEVLWEHDASTSWLNAEDVCLG